MTFLLHVFLTVFFRVRYDVTISQYFPKVDVFIVILNSFSKIIVVSLKRILLCTDFIQYLSKLDMNDEFRVSYVKRTGDKKKKKLLTINCKIFFQNDFQWAWENNIMM